MAKNKNRDKDIDLKKYNDPSGLTVEEMNFGLWLAENRSKLLRILIIFLILLSAGLFIYSSYGYIVYLTSGNGASTINTAVTSPRQVTSDMLIAPVQIFADANNNSDLAVKLSNPNDKFTATFQYCFTQAGQNLLCGNGYIMPGETKYILALNQTVTAGSGNITFQTSNLFWQRLDAHKIPDWSSYAAARLNFLVTGINFSSAADNSLSNKIPLNTLSFAIANQTAYGYYEVPLNLLFFNGSDLIGVNRYFLENFVSGESRDIKITWPGSLSGVSQTEIVPDINLMDSSIYAPYTGPAGTTNPAN